MTIDFPDELLELERSAWAAYQQGTLTAAQAAAVQVAVTEYATAAGLDRHEIEMALKRQVRHPESEG